MSLTDSGKDKLNKKKNAAITTTATEAEACLLFAVKLKEQKVLQRATLSSDALEICIISGNISCKFSIYSLNFTFDPHAISSYNVDYL